MKLSEQVMFHLKTKTQNDQEIFQSTVHRVLKVFVDQVTNQCRILCVSVPGTVPGTIPGIRKYSQILNRFLEVFETDSSSTNRHRIL